MTELRECPFCGSKDVGIVTLNYHGVVPELYLKQYSYAECMDCDARTGDCFDDDATLYGMKNGEELATAQWNTRPGVPTIDNEIQELTDQVFNSFSDTYAPISVEERLPENIDDVLVFYGVWQFGYYEPISGWRVYNGTGSATLPVTHWLPMPPAPKEGW